VPPSQAERKKSNAPLLKSLTASSAAEPLRLADALPDWAAAVDVRRHPRARRLTLKVDPHRRCVALVMPRRASKAAALEFLLSKEEWVRARQAKIEPPVPFLDGAVVPLEGRPITLVSTGTLRGLTRLEGDRLLVPGLAAHMHRRVETFLKAYAAEAIAAHARALAAAIGKPVTSVRVRDARSRWGSCTRGGKLMFSWRLILAPAFVWRYVVAHEVAHLTTLSHGPRFWAAARALDPNVDAAERWLNQHGHTLMRYGARERSEEIAAAAD
jgi:predicted metal-dependent hydrolase